MYMTGITQKCPVGNICHVSLNTKDRKTIKEFCLVCYLNFGFEVFRLLPPAVHNGRNESPYLMYGTCFMRVVAALPYL